VNGGGGDGSESYEVAMATEAIFVGGVEALVRSTRHKSAISLAEKGEEWQ
jgi:hypothetical protein